MKSVPFESFSYPFFDFTYKADHSALVNAFLNPGTVLPPSKGLKGLYIHIPFCETICRFCPFVKSVGSEERIRNYIDALEIELQMLGNAERLKSWQIDAIYFGGGTPSVLSNEQVTRVFRAIRENLQLADDCEITYEMEAKSVTREKLLCLKELGTTRVSFGLQTFDSVTRSILNLTPTQEQIAMTIELFAEIFPDNNMDMIVGLPGQDEEAMFRDLEKAVASKISSISVYPMDYVMTLPSLLDRIRRGEIPAPPNAPRLKEMFYQARHFLGNHFHESNIYSYGNEHATPSRYMFSIVYGGYYNQYIGVGCSSYTHLQGLMYQNVTSEEEYVRRLKQGRSPIQVSSPYLAYEKGIVFFPKLMRYDIGEMRSLDLLPLYEERIERLIGEGLLRMDGDTLRLTDEGEKHYAALMVEFFSDSQRRLYNKICKKLTFQIGWNDEQGTVLEGKSKIKTYGGLTAMTSTVRLNERGKAPVSPS